MSVFHRETSSQLVGLTGTLNAGKDTAANHLVNNHGFMHVSSGDVLRAEAKRQGLPNDRNTLIEIGVRLRKEYGNVGALVIKGVEQWQEQKEAYLGGLVVSGLRILGEAQEVHAQGGKLVFIDAPVEERYRRMVARQRDAEAEKTLEEFMEHERYELEGLGGSDRPHLRAIQAISDIRLDNSGLPELFIASLDESLGLAD
ncbi:MAG TPA: AAA family ATPase [Candidatus Saccharimonadales bacterium]|nr:AAA family ATPase [Candidatus Saccharimonadales bacterium]